jgi:hypothetical protein
MICYSEFKNLTEASQLQTLWVDGVYVDLVRYSKTFRINLYVLYDFYVEIFFDQVNDEPLYIKAFKDINKLNPYLKQIDIESLLTLK